MIERCAENSRRGLTVVEVSIVVAILVLVLGVAFNKFRSERMVQKRQISQVDRQQSIRRFLMWFRQDMQSMGTIRRFRVINSFDTEEDSRLVQIDFDKRIGEDTIGNVSYRFDFNARKMYRFLDGEKTFEIGNVANFQLKPYDYTRARILNVDLLPTTFYLDARIVISEQTTMGKGDIFYELATTVYPRVNASVHKAGFNQFRINGRFSPN